ncbi:hypothetical protein HHL11_09685 [Ramlibacter sp. G-1-2-2]|uniref:Uncharacterized protein n=1 Tax=Ramlibacter agri TaxID=2728837 RepID=A0A848H3C9_9BURK|nr:hypothetical protein [Ramlibacter agri]NML44019.1 hypothetical protein [Ramlibacter agri]
MNPNDMLSRIGGVVQGGSARPLQERDKLDREHGEEPTPNAESAKHQRGLPPQQHPAQVHPAQEHPPQRKHDER